jgi:serine/threonine-protein kinase
MNDKGITLLEGTVLSGTYQIIRQIGQGGMGTVYMAYDTRLDIKVAIKIISPAMAGTMDKAQYEGILKRFRSEARIAAKIDHPNVIRIFGFMHDTIEVDDHAIEIDYLVMELLAGRTLRDTMDVSGFEYDEEIKTWITTYMIPILEGLEKVHGNGIIHRDIKPENFFMKDNVAKLADFGLSMGFDLPSVTDSVADIFGTVTYMAPEQFYNFKMAREPADIFAIGRILYEVAEGKITEQVKPFKQVRLSNTDSDYRQALNAVIMSATAENPGERIKSARELMDRLIQIHYCRLDALPAEDTPKKTSQRQHFLWPLFIVVGLALGAWMVQYWPSPENRSVAPEQQTIRPGADIVHSIRRSPVAPGLNKIRRTKDNSVLHLIPRMDIKLVPDNPLGLGDISLDAFYLAENPVTNQQYVAFLNANLDRIAVIESDVKLDGRLVLKLSEKIRGYKPIVFEDRRFVVKDPMHSACAVLTVTGYGAELYARRYGLRLMRAAEWYAVMLTGNGGGTRKPLPTPVINYEQDGNSLRAINQIAEWGKSKADVYVILGQSPSEMIEADLLLKKDPTKYYTDTSFRVAKSAGNE